MPKLTFETFRIANLTRSKRFFDGATVDHWSRADGMVGFMGEIGEACNVLKKVKRAELGMVNKNKEGRQVDGITNDVRRDLMEEFAGALLYLDQVVNDCGIDWQTAIEYTFNEKSKELGFPERIVDGVFLLATNGTFKIGPEGHLQEFEGEIYRKPEEERPVTLTSDLSAIASSMGMSFSAATDVERSKYRAAWPEVNRRTGDRRSSDKPDVPIIWTEGCGKCRWCAMDMDMDPYCVNPEIKKESGSTVGIGLNTAVYSYCVKDGKLSLFEPRK